jgi:CRISPR-associated endonuclease/helicase Cas3
LAMELTRHRQVLCIVNRRQDCRDLWEAVRQVSVDPPVHLSALMCGEHRSKVIGRIKEDLSDGKPLRVITTQLVEAGVDIDFPVVYRAMAGLDSIAQAAGRCNREGKLKERLGEVVVFSPPKPSPKGLLLKGEQAGAEVLRNWPDRSTLISPEAFQKYFQCFYRAVNDFGRNDFKRHGFEDAGEGECRFQFRSAAQWYKLIDEQGYRGIAVWYESDRYSSRKVLEELRYAGPSRERMRRLQRCTVNVPERVWQTLRDQGSIAEVKGPEGLTGVWAQCVDKLYDDTFGLKLEGPEDFIC